MSTFEIEIVNTLSGLLALENDWRALESRLPALPFVSFDWNVAWWQHLREQKLSVTDELAIRTFRSASGELCAVAPLMLTRRPVVGPMQFRQLQFFGADPNMTEIRGIAAPDTLRQYVYADLLEHLQMDRDSWDWLEFSGIPSAPALVSAVKQRFPDAVWLQDVCDYSLPLAPTWAEFKHGLSRNIKESLRKCYNSPKRDGITFSIEVARTDSEVTAAVEEFLRLHLMRSELRETTHHNNVFATESARHFLFDVCLRFAARDAIRIFQLKIADKVIATRIGFALGDTLYLYYSGYNPAYSQYSIMTTALAEAIQYAIAEGFRSVNLSTGQDVSKDRWSPNHFLYRNAMLVSPSWRGRVKHRTYSVVRNSLDNLPTTMGLRGLLSRRS